MPERSPGMARIFALLLGLGIALTALPGLAAEKLRVTPPADWIESPPAGAPARSAIDYLPPLSAPKTWRERISVRLLPATEETDPAEEAFKRLKAMAQACADKLAAAKLIRTHVSGRPGAMLLGACENTKPSTDPATTATKITLRAAVLVRGEAGLYVVQRDWGAEAKSITYPMASDRTMQAWLKPITEVTLCKENDTDLSCQPG